MQFTKDWTKEDNDFLRKLIKERKTPDEITEIIGIEKLEKNPKKKYVGRFSEFILNEISATPKNTLYNLKQEKSKYFKDKINYIINFETDSNQVYFIDLVYIEDKQSPFPNIPIFNISFTIEQQHDLSNSLKYEKDTDKGEFFELMNRMSYILIDVDKIIRLNNPNIVYMIGETTNPQKINAYRDIIKTTFLNFKELKGYSSFNLGKPSYYYYI